MSRKSDFRTLVVALQKKQRRKLNLQRKQTTEQIRFRGALQNDQFFSPRYTRSDATVKKA